MLHDKKTQNATRQDVFAATVVLYGRALSVYTHECTTPVTSLHRPLAEPAVSTES